MAPGTLFGLVLAGAGILVLTVSRPLTNIATQSQAYLRPSLDKTAFKRRNIRILRYMAIIWIVVGMGIVIFALVTGG
jgi:hypothetical protein